MFGCGDEFWKYRVHIVYLSCTYRVPIMYLSNTYHVPFLDGINVKETDKACTSKGSDVLGQKDVC